VRGLAEAGRRWDAALLTGLVPGSARERALAGELGERYRLQVGPSMTRQVADIGGGLESYLARRSPRFRRNLRQAERRRRDRRIDVELVRGGGVEVVERCIAVERRSWKGAEGSGLAEDGFADFYRTIARGLAPAGRLRAGFARSGDRDVAFILGAVRGGVYRGLQLGYDEAFAELSLGNLLQLHQIEALVDEAVESYDLGMDMAYKRQWADRSLTTRTLVVSRR
jgi:CelD/BcsL family acetyltransferase involved in cellulose biosynthesis